MTGIVEITREAGFGGTIMAGCPSRETIFSIDPVVTVSTWLALVFLACGSLEAGTILVGSVLALIVGGSVAITEPPEHLAVAECASRADQHEAGYRHH